MLSDRKPAIIAAAILANNLVWEIPFDMKILLVQPKSSGYMGQISKSGKAGFARVTLTTIAALTPPEHEVVIHDARLSEPDYDGQWDLVGFTGMTCEIPHVYRMAAEFRKRGIIVVIGGYHATAYPMRSPKKLTSWWWVKPRAFGKKSFLK